MALSENSSDAKVPAVTGSNTAPGAGILGVGKAGVVGADSPPTRDFSKGFFSVGIQGLAAIGVAGEGPVTGVVGTGVGEGIGVIGNNQSTNAEGRLGAKNPFHDEPVGAYGQSDKFGVLGVTNKADGIGVFGTSMAGAGIGVSADSDSNDALQATTRGVNKSAVFALNSGRGDAPGGGPPGGNGVFGLTMVHGGTGVFGSNNSNGPKGRGVQGNGPEAGVGGFSDAGSGVLAQSKTGIAILAQGGGLAGRFEGDVEVTGDIRLVNADVAEDFATSNRTLAEPGTVMALDDGGMVRPSDRAYDKRVAGVVSGAGDYKPAIVLNKTQAIDARTPIALVGKVYCKADAQYAAIEIGDLLTTSPTPGHAMRVGDATLAFGSVIGKALGTLRSGRGLVPILIALQ